MIPISDDRFNSLEWKSCDWDELNEMISGLEVMGAEPCGLCLAEAPFAREGVCIYFRAKDNGVLVVCIDTDLDYPQLILLSKATADQDMS